MPEFRVVFERPVCYLPDDKLRRREVRDLLVNAPTAADALTHAIRVTQGPTGQVTVEPADIWTIQNERLRDRRIAELANQLGVEIGDLPYNDPYAAIRGGKHA